MDAKNYPGYCSVCDFLYGSWSFEAVHARALLRESKLNPAERIVYEQTSLELQLAAINSIMLTPIF